MQDHIGGCLGGAAAAAPARPFHSTAVYETEEGEASLTWSSASFGLSLRVDLRLPFEEDDPFTFRLRPWLLWKRKGTKKFREKNATVEFSWDLRRARFPPGGGPRPVSGYYVSISVAGRFFLAVGDMLTEAQKKAKRPITAHYPSLVCRREDAVISAAGGSFRTRVRVGLEEKEVRIEIRGPGVRLWLDGKAVLRVDRLEWKFRGSEKVEMTGGAGLQVSWDLYRWLFDRRATGGGEFGHAVFVIRVDGDEMRRWRSSSSSSSSSGRSSSVVEWASGEDEDSQRLLHCPTLLVSIWRA